MKTVKEIAEELDICTAGVRDRIKTRGIKHDGFNEFGVRVYSDEKVEKIITKLQVGRPKEKK